MIRAHSGIQKGRYSFALKELAAADRYTEPTPQLKAEILYLKGVCYRGLGQNAEADALFKYVIEKFGETEYAAVAKAQLARPNSASTMPPPK